MAAIGQPLALVDIPTRPLEHAIATHVALLPLTVVELSLRLGWIALRWPLALEQTLAVILAIVPLTSVAALAPIEHQITKLASLAFLEVAQVDLLQVIGVHIVKDSHKAGAIWLSIHFGSMVH